MDTDWLFDNPPNTASFTTSFVVDGSPILRVYHDYDGGWQFHGPPAQPATYDVARLVSLGSMIARDSTLRQLHDLRPGWRAFRDDAKATWQRQKNNPCPTHAENGYYLGDAVWLSQYRDDVHPPPSEVRESLAAGTYAKLVFRFAAEDASRRDYDSERMWVLVTGVDENEYYFGTLENEPNHVDILRLGDTVRFHPLHVMAILTDDDP